MKKIHPISLPVMALTLALTMVVTLTGLAAPAQAARERDNVPARPSFSPQGPTANPLVERLQRALRKAGYYNGPISGSINAATEAAIRDYQRRENVAISGIVTERLVSKLETSVGVRSLLRQLKRQRLLKITAARKALMRNPQTRRLLDGSAETVKPADPTRDPAPCFRRPDPRCLLAEASASARAVFRERLRNWALSEILVAEAKAGLTGAAMNTVRRIEDPRLIIVALRDIAEAQAEGGRPTAALAAAAIIPDPVRRAEALAAIAAIQATDSAPAALKTVKTLFATVALIDDPLRRIALLSLGAIIEHRSGAAAAAAATLAEARRLAERQGDRKSRAAGLRQVANALAETARPELALAVIRGLPEPSEQTPVLVSAATAQARAGDPERALATAGGIASYRYKTVLLGRIALAQAAVGEMTAAGRTLKLAMAAISGIKLPFARDYARKRIALTLNAIAGLQAGGAAAGSRRRAVALAGRMGDNMLRASTLWAIADAERSAGRNAEAGKTEALAKTATAAIRSRLTRVWMFSNIALERHRGKPPTGARRAFDRALKLSEDLDDPWVRARALARLASTLVDLSAGN